MLPAVLLAVVAMVLGAVSAPAGAASAAPAGAHPDVLRPVAALDWSAPHPSLSTDPVELVRAQLATAGPVADPSAPLRVLLLQETVHGARVEVVEVTDADAAAERLDDLQDAPGAVAVAVDGTRTTTGDAQTQPPRAGGVAPGAPSRDERRPEQWAMQALDAELAWIGGRGAGTVVAVVDTGVDARHPDLAGRVLPGYDTVVDDPLPWRDGRTDPEGHGTHVAGIVAAVADNGTGVAGLAPQASVLPVRVLDRSGTGHDSEIAEGIIWAADHGADVVNLSLSGPQNSGVLARAVAYAQAQGALVVAAAGNEGRSGNAVQYPAAYPGVVGVAALGTATAAASYSSSGRHVDLSAPGSGVVSTLPRGRYGVLDGSSMAAPYVSAAAAVVLGASGGSLLAADLAAALERGAADLGPTGRDVTTGSGRVSPVQTMCLLQLWCPPAWAAVAPRLTLTPATGSVSSGSPAAVVLSAFDAATTAPVSGLPVVLTVQRHGAPAGRQVVVTGPDGTIRLSQVVLRTTTWSAVSAGTALYRAATAAPAAVAATPTVSVTVSRGRATVRITPAAGQQVVLRRWSKGYAPVARRTVGVDGTVVFSGLSAGFYTVDVPASPGLARVVSRSWRV